jgi:DNA-binding LacI/PurR family transcriptional regulator
MNEAPNSKITLEHVAELARVSRATASRVLTANPRVSPESRRAVERAARKLGYIPNHAARALATGHSDAVALVISEPTSFIFGDPFFPRLIRGIDDVLAARDKQLILLAPQSPTDLDRLERYVAAGHSDGVLLVSLHGTHPLPGRLAARGIPIVVGGRPEDADLFTYVDIDNVGGAFAAVSHLAGRGRRQIATISGPQDASPGRDRLIGYRSALESEGLAPNPAIEETADFTHEGGERAMRRLLERCPSLDAVFAASDLMAAGALRTLAEAGRRVPDDVAVVGYDDDPIAATTSPALTSVRQPIEEMGREMARLLLDAMHAPRRVILTTEIQVRLSSGRMSEAM